MHHGSTAERTAHALSSETRRRESPPRMSVTPCSGNAAAETCRRGLVIAALSPWSSSLWVRVEEEEKRLRVLVGAAGLKQRRAGESLGTEENGAASGMRSPAAIIVAPIYLSWLVSLLRCAAALRLSQHHHHSSGLAWPLRCFSGACGASVPFRVARVAGR